MTGYGVSGPGTRNTGREVVEMVGEGRDILSKEEVVIDNRDIKRVPTKDVHENEEDRYGQNIHITSCKLTRFAIIM